MSRIAIAGTGVVSPAGWGMEEFREVVAAAEPVAIEERERPGREGIPNPVRCVPKPEVKLPFFRDPRLRRTSPIGRFIAGAALEALGEERIAVVKSGDLRLGVVTTLYCGCVNYSQRFYREVLEDPGTASPIVFPETVFNAPSSHLSAMLGAHAMNYTMVGDSAEFLGGLEIAARWLLHGEVDGCLVVCGEELDWLTAEAMGMFEPGCVMGEGGVALYLEKASAAEIELAQIAGPELITAGVGKREASRRVRDQVIDADGLIEIDPLATRGLFGEGLGVAAGWQCLLGIEVAKAEGAPVLVQVDGTNEHCAGAVFSPP